MENSFIYPNECKAPQYEFLVDTELISNYKQDREKFLNNLKANANDTSLYSYPNYTFPSKNIYINNDLLFPVDNKNLGKSRNICFCNCHLKKDEFIPYPCITKFSSFFIEKKNELNHDLIYKVNKLKNSLKKFENDLNKTNNEKEESNLYIKKLEKELTKSKMNKLCKDNNYKIKDKKSFKIINNKNNNILDKSFNILNSIPNEINNYRLEKNNKDYSYTIETQKKWLDTLSANHESNIKDYLR